MVIRQKFLAAALVTVCGLALVGPALAGLTHGALDMLVDFVSPVYWFFLVLSGAAVIVLGRRFPEVHRPFRVPVYRLLPRMFCATSGCVLYATVVYSKWGIGVLLLGQGRSALRLSGCSAPRSQHAVQRELRLEAGFLQPLCHLARHITPTGEFVRAAGVVEQAATSAQHARKLIVERL